VWNLPTGVRTLVVPLIPVVMLAWLPELIRLRNAVLLIPPVLTGVILYPLWHNSPYSPRIWPLAIAVGWAQVLALWDYGRGKVTSWQPSRGPADAGRRLRRGVVLWNGTLALAWPCLAAWRIEQTASWRFTIIALLGVLNLLVVGRLVFPGRNAA
jgi:cellulose synthase (UDP-forming)